MWWLLRLPSIMSGAVSHEFLKDLSLHAMALPYLIPWAMASYMFSSILTGGHQVSASVVFLGDYVSAKIPVTLTTCFDTYSTLLGGLLLGGCWDGGSRERVKYWCQDFP